MLDVPEDLLAVQEALAAALDRVVSAFDAQLESDLPPVSALCRHIAGYRGKMLRPTLVLLCGLAAHPGAAEACEEGPEAIGGLWSDEHVGLAAVVEMVHMATLVHDDVLDDAAMRRRTATVNTLRGNEAAVILGDYLIAAAYRLCSTVQSEGAAVAVGSTAMTLCAGELLQLHHREDLSLDVPTYIEIVDRKTAALIGLSCALGSAASRGGDGVTDALRQFGRLMGIAFQIQDDILDLTGEESVVGKSVRKDLDKGKLTLPMILALQEAGEAERGRLLRLIERAAGDGTARSELAGALADSGAVDAATREAEGYVSHAMPLLDRVPASPAVGMLRFSAAAVVARKH